SQPAFMAQSSWEESFCREHKNISCLEFAVPSHDFVPAAESYSFAQGGECDNVKMISVAWESVHGHGFMDKTDDDMSLVNEDICLNSGPPHQTEYMAADADDHGDQFIDHYSSLASEEESTWTPKDNLIDSRAYYDTDERPVEAAAIRETTTTWIPSASKSSSPKDLQYRWPPKMAAKNAKVKDSSCHHEDHEALNYGVMTGSRNAPRVCVDCKTTKTPLWRSGPHGPKSLCNACGIRHRKARRALSAFGSADHIAAYKSRLPKRKQQQVEDGEYKFVRHKKRSRLSIPSCKKNMNVKFTSKPSPHSLQRVFAEDEKEGAVLLMGLSSGLVHL
ncbi:hypothetical protein KI387_007362, partial [Taxus chinensis]